MFSLLLFSFGTQSVFDRSGYQALIWSLITLTASKDVSMHFRDTMRNNTQGFLKFESFSLRFCLHPINLNFTRYVLISAVLTRNAGTSKAIPIDEIDLSLPQKPIVFPKSILTFQLKIFHQKNEDIWTNPYQIQWYGFVLCGAIAGWTKSTQI